MIEQKKSITISFGVSPTKNYQKVELGVKELTIKYSSNAELRERIREEYNLLMSEAIIALEKLEQKVKGGLMV